VTATEDWRADVEALVDQACIAVEPAFEDHPYRSKNELLWTAANAWAPAPVVALLTRLPAKLYRDPRQVREALQSEP